VDIAGADPRTMLAVRRETMGYVSQFLRVVPRVSALDIVAEEARDVVIGQARDVAVGQARGVAIGQARGVTAERARDGERHERARALLVRLNIPERLHGIPPATFSGGEQQRINLARGFISGHPILLLDEPTASLDAENRAVVIDMINRAKAEGIAIVAICHDADVRDAIADRLFTMTPYQEAA
jgi:alpha-D-ribose 1-methylphosphonate 5-triphosphate synthase subunit PhnL